MAIDVFRLLPQDKSLDATFNNLFGDSSVPKEASFDIHNPNLYACREDYIYACEHSGVAVRIGETEFNLIKQNSSHQGVRP